LNLSGFTWAVYF